MARGSTFRRTLASFALLLSLFGTFGMATRTTAANDATPTIFVSLCDAVPFSAATPDADHGSMMGGSSSGMMAGTPGADMPMMANVDFDLMFIDMMIPHHESAVAMAQIAIDRAEHPEVRALAESIIASQTAEIAQMQEWRDAWYPGAVAMPIDQMNAIMTGLMHGMMDNGGLTDAGLMAGMDMGQEVVALCNTETSFDLAFLTAMIPHHQSAIVMSNIGLENSSHPELKTLQLAIIDAQQAEIDQMKGWLAAWYPAATPAS